MKTLKTLLSVFAIAAVFSTGTYAQQNINATATVVDAIAFGTHQDLAFGTLASGDTKTISADSSSAGYFEITSYAQSNTIVAGLSYTDFTGGSAPSFTESSTVKYSFSASAAPNNSNPTLGSDATGGNIATNTETDNLYIYIGGSVDATGASAGTYTDAQITLTVEYL
ncbi:hypothetical protein [Gracilimonas sp.]|uniref:hypothetical protein n=1 Tax=Gracilimonas sp. TaxID=1974203 RepID=UPI0032EC3C67